MPEFEIKDDELIMFAPGGELKTFSIASDDGKHLIEIIAKEFEITQEKTISLLQEFGPIELFEL